jgi:RNA polymerase sigma factor (sigma-70 family)
MAKVPLDPEPSVMDNILSAFNAGREKDREEAERLEEEIIALDKALSDLASVDPLKCSIVELRFYAGCTFDEIAEQLDLTPDKAKQEWKLARAWLHREIDRIIDHAS